MSEEKKEELEEEAEEPCGECGKLEICLSECEYCHNKLCSDCDEVHLCDQMPEEIKFECEECCRCHHIYEYTEMTKDEKGQSFCDECILEMMNKDYDNV